MTCVSGAHGVVCDLASFLPFSIRMTASVILGLRVHRVVCMVCLLSLRCGKVILVFGLYADVGQANVATALEPKQAAAR
jgi:hypothetical protein